MKSCVKIRVSPYLVFLLGFAAYFGAGRLLFPAILAAVCHEMGHIAYLFWKKRKIHEISFDVCGAVIRSEPLGTREEAVCAILGPLINLALSFALYHRFPWFARSGLVLGVYNLLPIYPLDGGRVLAAFLPMPVVRYVGDGISLLVLAAAFSVCVHFQLYLWPCMAMMAILFRIWCLGRKEAL